MGVRLVPRDVLSAEAARRGFADAAIGAFLRHLETRTLETYPTEIEAARIAHCSRATIKRRMNEVLGIGYRRLRHALRMRAAQDLLESTDTPIKLIATLSGFKTPASFGYAFRQHQGISPAAFRRRGKS